MWRCRYFAFSLSLLPATRIHLVVIISSIFSESLSKNEWGNLRYSSCQSRICPYACIKSAVGWPSFFLNNSKLGLSISINKSSLFAFNMAKSAKNSGKPWTSGEVSQLKALAKQNTPTRVMGLKLGRSEEAVRSKAGDEGISLKPTNQSPYNRKK